MNTCPHRSVSLVELRNLTPIPFRLSLDTTISKSSSSSNYQLYRKSHLIISPIPFKLSIPHSTSAKHFPSTERTSAISDESGSLPAPPYRVSLKHSLPPPEVGSTKRQRLDRPQTNLPAQKTNPIDHPRTDTSAARSPLPSPAGNQLCGSKRKAIDHPPPLFHQPADTEEPPLSRRKRRRRRQNRRQGHKEPSPAISDDSVDRQVMTAATAEEMGAAAEMWIQKTMRKLGYPELLTSGGSG
ncbi:hypothetical protein DFP73DRAFT_528063 [Morchella snyderi]|nr:hypothetical protein DFP73DRAFT_528063 [Morchella snyderi]